MQTNRLKTWPDIDLYKMDDKNLLMNIEFLEESIAGLENRIDYLINKGYNNTIVVEKCDSNTHELDFTTIKENGEALLKVCQNKYGNIGMLYLGFDNDIHNTGVAWSYKYHNEASAKESIKSLKLIVAKYNEDIKTLKRKLKEYQSNKILN